MVIITENITNNRQCIMRQRPNLDAFKGGVSIKFLATSNSRTFNQVVQFCVNNRYKTFIVKTNPGGTRSYYIRSRGITEDVVAEAVGDTITNWNDATTTTYTILTIE